MSDSVNTERDSQGDAARELLVSRIVDGAATPEDWATLRVLASGEPEVWAELAQTQAQNAQLQAAVGAAIGVADAVDLPDMDDLAGDELGGVEPHGVSHRIETIRSWGGWAAAAVVAVVWFTGIRVNDGGTVDAMPPSGNTAGLVDGPRLLPTAASNADEALDRYIELGRAEGSVIAAMPEEVVLETRSLGDGSAEVLYLRQILERRVVDQFYTLATDELGRAVAVADPEAGRPVSPH